MRYNDIHDGTEVAPDVVQKYSTAWKSKGIQQDDGLFVSWYSPKQGTLKTSRDIGSTAW
jgi:hypothetical protein